MSASSGPGEAWVKRLEAQGVPKAAVDEARAQAAKFAQAAEGVAFDLTDPPEIGGFDLAAMVAGRDDGGRAADAAIAAMRRSARRGTGVKRRRARAARASGPRARIVCARSSSSSLGKSKRRFERGVVL